MDGIDEELLRLLARRQQITGEIGAYKVQHNMPVLQSDRYREIIEKRTQQGRLLDLDAAFVTAVMETIHKESIRRQLELVADAEKQ